MANTQAMCASFKSELMLGAHQLGAVTIVSRTSLTAPTVDTIKAALFLTTATVNAAYTTYSATGEVSGTGYSGFGGSGGVTVTNATTPTNNGTSAYWTPSASIVYTTVTLSTAFDTMLLYNATQSGRAIAAYTFGAQTITAGTLTLTMPVNAVGTALLQIT